MAVGAGWGGNGSGGGVGKTPGLEFSTPLKGLGYLVPSLIT